MSESVTLPSAFARLSSTEVRLADSVNEADLTALARGEAIAIVVREYCPPALCREIVKRLIDDGRYGEYENVPGVHKWGLNTYEGLSSREREDRYFADAVPAVRAMRSTWSPHLSPMDRLRLELQEAWPAGANLELLDGRRLFVGQARIFEKDNGAIPHQDFLPWELADLRKSRRSDGTPELIGQLTSNLYLQTPEEGGQLELWPFGYDHEEYDELRLTPDSYGLDRQRLSEPAARIRPEPGMLVLFHASRLHAVLPSRGSSRIALSCFIGMRGIYEPLTYWS